MSSPLISVVMPVHNGLPHVQEAIHSILNQSFDDFEFICIDDASTDGSTDLLASVRDKRVHLVHNRKRLGLSVTLNRALRMARGQYWARMDADDISLSRRLEQQAAFLDAHPEISLVGAWAKTLGLAKEQTWKMPSNPDAVKAEILFNSPLVHSAIMLRRQDFLQARLRYNPSVARAQDYDLWERAAQKLKMANLPKVLQRYRIHSGQVGQRYGAGQAHIAAKVRARQLRRVGLKPSSRELRLHNAIATWQFPVTTEGLLEIEGWLLKLHNANKKSKLFQMPTLDASLEQRWWNACRFALAKNERAWRIYSSSQLAQVGNRRLVDKAAFWMKSGLLK